MAPAGEARVTEASVDWVRVGAAVASLTALLVMALAGLFNWVAVRELAVMFTGYVGFGSAALQFANGYRGIRYCIVSIGIGLASVSLIGFLLLELQIWDWSRLVFILICLIAAGFHVASLKLNLSGRIADSRSQVGRALQRIRMSELIVRAGPSFVGIVLCLVGAGMSQDLIPGHGGLLASISPLWIAGVVVMIAGVVICWFDQRSSLALPILALLVTVVATPAVVYQYPRYGWSQKHVGVTLHFLQSGILDRKIDIYQSWPAFFGGVAWLCKAVSVSNVEAVARWWPAATDIVNMLTLFIIGNVLGLSKRRSWLVVALFTLGNTVGQDYFSPQSASFLLMLIVMALSLHPDGTQAPFAKSDLAVICLLVLDIAVTHQLTPFVTVLLLAVFVVFGLLKRRSIPIIAFVPAAAWAAVNVSTIRQHFNVWYVGNVAANIHSTNAAGHYHYAWFIRVGDIGQGAAPLLVGITGLIALFTWRRRITFGLAVAAGSCSLLTVAVHYGNEDIYRGALFALPWVALLAGHIRLSSRRLVNIALPVLVTALVFSYIIGDMGFDDTYVTRPADLAAALYFENSAPAGSRLIVIGSYSVDEPLVSARYPLYTVGIYLSGGLPSGSTPAEAANSVTDNLIAAKNGSGRHLHVYVLGTLQAATQLADDGVMSLEEYQQLGAEFVRTGHWKVVYRSDNAFLLEST
jgi:hypothetical protein